MCKETLLRIYEMSVVTGEARSQVLEQAIGEPHLELITIDDERNEPEMYARLFGDQCRATVDTVRLSLLRNMKGLTFEQARDHIQGLSFLQLVGAKALWKYRQDVGVAVEEFVREFDRLDVESERVRLHDLAQSVG